MRALAALALAIAALTRPRASELHRFEAVEPHMGTLVRITVYVPGEAQAVRAFRAAFDRIRELDETLSDYRADSELNRLTATAVGRPVPVSTDLFTILRASQDLAEATGGAFDITQGPVIRLWRDARTTGRVPEPEARRDASRRSGFRKLHLDVERRTVSCDVPGMALDVGAIGKGYAASEALAVLGKQGVRSALVAVSGDLAFSDAPPGQRGWRIGVDAGDASLENIPGVLELTNLAVSTSGSSEQHLDVGNTRYSHVIDPTTGMGLSKPITVTVIARHGMDADGLDTAVSVLGRERGLALVESHPDAAALIVEPTSAGPVATASSRFRALAAAHAVREREEQIQ